MTVHTHQAVAEWAQPNRQQLARSNAFSLMANDASAEEIRAAITDEIRDALPDAITGWEAEALPAVRSRDGMRELIAELGKYIRITGTSMGHDERQEWIEGAAEELAAFPMSLVLPEVAAARRREPWANKLVAAVCEKVEAKAARLLAEGDRLKRLQELAAA
jgi:hypothetical protein